jgi:16S rRNA (adenine1518-N6/adenine1519-N6)-dimethyltransferase
LQTRRDISALLDSVGQKPQRRLGQHFLVDLRYMERLLELAEVAADACVLEVGAGTGSLTEALRERAGRVVAVEVDRALAELLRRRFAEDGGVRILATDALAGKHALAPEVLAALEPSAELVANLPYHIATPLVAECLSSAWRSLRSPQAPEAVRFGRLTFTVQREVADRLASTGGSEYGIVSVLVRLLGAVQLGPVISPGAFWPAPKVTSRLVRIDFDPGQAGRVRDLPTLQALLRAAFTQRRKHVGKVPRARGCPFSVDVWSAGLEQARIDPTRRADEIPPEAWCAMGNAMLDSGFRIESEQTSLDR